MNMKNQTEERNEIKIKSAIVYEELFEPLFQQFAAAAIDSAGGVSKETLLIDIAAGTGALGLLAARKGASVLAIDISAEMLDRLSARITDDMDCTVSIMDGQNLQVADAAYDLSFSVFGVMTFPDWRKGLKEMLRVTKTSGKGGVVVFNEDHGFMAPYLLAYQAAFQERQIPPLPEGMQVLSSVENLHSEMIKAGFAQVDVCEISRPRLWSSADEFLNEAKRLCSSFFPLYMALTESERTQFDISLQRVADKYLTPSGGIRIPVDALIAIGTR